VPEPISAQDMTSFIDFLRADAGRTFNLLRDNVSRLPEDLTADAEQLLRQENGFIARLQQFKPLDSTVSKIRIHGDYHLGQVLRVKNDYVIIDFEGEPDRSLAERRAKMSALKDVAGMMRSLSYAAYSALLNYTNRRPDQMSRVVGCAKLWESEMSSLFLRTYFEHAKDAVFLPKHRSDLQQLLKLYVLERLLYELRYELNNRPGWTRIPLQTMAAMI